RLALLVQYWGLCLVALGFHFNDLLWREGHALSVALQGPYFSARHELFRSLSLQFPRGYALVGQAALVVQVGWELLLLPLMYWRPSRWFVLLQGLAFFACSLALLHLQYLPLAELTLWALVFGTGWCAPGPAAEPRPAWGLLPVRGFALASAVAAGIHLTLCPFELEGDVIFKPPAKYTACQPFFRLFAQRPVSVFNRPDMDVSSCWFVLHET